MGGGGIRRPILALATAFALAACGSFESDKPLVSTAQADRPLTVPATIDVFGPDEHGSWVRRAQGAKLTLSDAKSPPGSGWYVLQTPPSLADTDKPDEPVEFLLRSIAPDAWVAEVAPASYGLLVRRPDSWLVYGIGDASNCKSLSEAELSRYHVAVSGTEHNTCKLDSLADLEALFRHIQAKAPPPDLLLRLH
ncbi:MAG TPA: hypothetical protein VKS60_13250 [Stellaceae bacterium]|nr:hypothetical protein [Stellaceae bacterium]